MSSVGVMTHASSELRLYHGKMLFRVDSTTKKGACCRAAGRADLPVVA